MAIEQIEIFSANDHSRPLPWIPDHEPLRTSEGAELHLRVTAGAQVICTLEGEELHCRGIKLRAGKVVCEFIIPIFTWAGRSEVRVQAGEDVKVIALDVSSNPRKLGQDAFRELLDELTQTAKDLPWGLSPGRTAAREARDSPSVIHPMVLSFELPFLQRALERVRADPLIRTTRQRALLPLAAARALDSTSFRYLLQHPPALAAACPDTLRTGRSALNIRVLIDQPFTASRLDHPATRYLRTLLERLCHRIKDAVARFQKVAKGYAEGAHNAPAQARARMLLEEIQTAHATVAQSLNWSPFRELSSGEPSASALQTIADHPAYAQVQRIINRLLDPGLQIDPAGAISSPLRYTHELFELVVLYRLARALAESCRDGWTWSPPGALRERELLRFPKDECFCSGQRADGVRIELHSQRQFHAYQEQAPDFLSLSGERRPDYVVGVFAGDVLLDWLVLDAKYRSSRKSLHEALAEMHVYRDSLRWRGKRPVGAFILVPAVAKDATVYAGENYLAQHRFGIWSMDCAPSMRMRPLIEWIQSTLSGLAA